MEPRLLVSSFGNVVVSRSVYLPVLDILCNVTAPDKLSDDDVVWAVVAVVFNVPTVGGAGGAGGVTQS